MFFRFSIWRNHAAAPSFDCKALMVGPTRRAQRDSDCRTPGRTVRENNPDTALRHPVRLRRTGSDRCRSDRGPVPCNNNLSRLTDHCTEQTDPSEPPAPHIPAVTIRSPLGTYLRAGEGNAALGSTDQSRKNFGWSSAQLHGGEDNREGAPDRSEALG